MQRVFIAIDISDAARVAVAEYIDALRREFGHVRVGWEKPEKLHLTLKFLGNFDDTRLGVIKDSMALVASESLSISLVLTGTGVFPNTKNPRVLWLGFEESGDRLRKLAESVEHECEKVGFPKEDRAFTPHLTIARLREPQKSRKLAEAHVSNSFDPIEFSANEIVVYKSELRRTGSVYSKLAVLPMRS